MTRKNRLLEGIAASPGIVMGPAHVLTQEGQVSTRLLYNDQEVAEELTRFNRAVDQTEEELTRLRSEIAEDLKEHAHIPVSYTHLRAHETDSYLVCRLL